MANYHNLPEAFQLSDSYIAYKHISVSMLEMKWGVSNLSFSSITGLSFWFHSFAFSIFCVLLNAFILMHFFCLFDRQIYGYNYAYIFFCSLNLF